MEAQQSPQSASIASLVGTWIGNSLVPFQPSNDAASRLIRRQGTNEVRFSSRWQQVEVFATLTAIFVKIGVEHVNSDFVTFIRPLVILIT